ncbi:condensin complex subunit 1 [Limosa lapponica baueri]|uniref:Condensin complex subunit 1 n=1 Tax=Limosa lapponica baueri TaxID=1758121 RepID=A0A2I0TTH6_LIMLA|nr:condensin complex subunit 1 [Limosa lapponica baueri]
MASLSSSWEFHLPFAPADLLQDGGPGRYMVQEVLTARELPPALTAFRTAFRARGALAVLQHFDPIYSLLHHFRAVDTAVKEDALELMTQVVSQHSNELPAILGDSGLSHGDRTAHLNALKMNCYLLTGLVDAFEMETCKSGLLEVDPGGKNKKNRTKTSRSLWEEEREPLLQLLTRLLQLDLRQLWGGLVVEEEFVSLMTGSCYRILENSSIGFQKYRATREAVTHLLAAALVHYDHMFSATLKITQMLQHFEHVAPVFAQAVSLWATEYGLKSLVGELLREIGHKCPQDLARDASGIKGYATFITELAERIPALVLSNISVLLRHLDGESYVMRNAVLAAMAEVLVQVLNGDQLEEVSRGTRDQFLNMLQAHICDINGFVRSRVLQLFTRIVQCKASRSAARLTQKALCRFQGMEPFSGLVEENEEATILGVLKRLYTGKNSEDPPRGNSSLNTEEIVPEEQPQTELVKQEMLVQYLQDAYDFSVKITEALSLISKMMYENSVSVLHLSKLGLHNDDLEVFGSRVGAISGAYSQFCNLSIRYAFQGFAQPSSHWIPFMEAAVTLIYQLAEGAEEICAQILQLCSQQTLEKLQEADGQKADPGVSPSRVSDGASTLPTFLLMHLVSLVGQVALQQVAYLEVSVSAELRRRRILREEEKATKKHSDSSTKKQRPRSTGNETTMEEELGLVGASADDTEAELIRSICETELLDGKHLFSAFVPLVLKICNNPGLYSDPALSAAAALTLGKVCMISSEFCDSHLRLLFTMMEKSTLPGVRSNLIIAAGDLAIRFPNLVEPWTSQLYARLRDPCPSVRQTAGLVMTHLILKDMVKVKGQVSEMATLLIDPEEAIMGVAQNFFSELSNKASGCSGTRGHKSGEGLVEAGTLYSAQDNAIYNLLPDIISRLSDPNCGVEEESFHIIMRHLFSYITKDKQTESLVEKLCQRFRTARTERQYRDLSHCLTLLPLSERGLHKLQDNFDCFADKLQDPAVYSCFQTVLTRFRRAGGKPEIKALAEELEQKLAASHNRGLDSAETCQEGSGTPMPGLAKRKTTGSSRRHPLRTVNRDEGFVTPQPRNLRNHKGAQKRHPPKKAIITFSSDEENSSEDDLIKEELLRDWGDEEREREAVLDYG